MPAFGRTLLITGLSGFLAKHIACLALEHGYTVIGTLRNTAHTREIIDSISRPLIQRHLPVDRISCVEADLDSDAGWEDAMRGVDAVIHTASPFPVTQPRNPEPLIRTAVQGTLRILETASRARVHRVVMTSSLAAITQRRLEPGRRTYDELNWSDSAGPNLTPYVRSKTQAEQAAWEFVRRPGSQVCLTVINPGLILGPLLDGNLNTSTRLVERMLSGRDSMVPRIGFAVVDVRDVAAAHIRALDSLETSGKRFIVADRFLWYAEMARLLKIQYPDLKITDREAPDALIRVMALFDSETRSIVPRIGQREDVETLAAQKAFHLRFIPAETALMETASSLIRRQRAGDPIH